MSSGFSGHEDHHYDLMRPGHNKESDGQERKSDNVRWCEHTLDSVVVMVCTPYK